MTPRKPGRHKRTCRLLPGTRYNSQSAAEVAELERKINSGAGGQRNALTYKITPCRCGGVHLIADKPNP